MGRGAGEKVKLSLLERAKRIIKRAQEIRIKRFYARGDEHYRLKTEGKIRRKFRIF